MKQLVALAVVVALGAGACWAKKAPAPSLTKNDWARDAELVGKLSERSVKLRAGLVAFAAQNRDTQRITGDEHAAIDKAMRDFGAIRYRLWDVAERYREIAGVELRDGGIIAGLKASAREARDLKRPGESLQEGVDRRLLASLMGLAAATVLIENAAVALENFSGTIFELRGDRPVVLTGDADARIAADMNLIVENLFHEVMRSFGDTANRKTYLRAVDYVLDHEDRLDELTASDGAFGPAVPGLKGLVFGSEAGTEFAATISKKAERAARREARKGLLVKRLARDTNAVSKVFGNGVGSIHLGRATVEGELRERVHARLMELLQPGDLLLDKTLFAMTDRLIPGHFGHVAIWLGTPEQVEALGLYDPAVNTDPESLKRALEWKSRIESGACVAEALRPGVTVNTLEHFLNLDEVLVLRLKPRFGSGEELQALRGKIVARAVRHLGQRYDFNFDVNTSDTIVCSEMAYQAYPDTVAWPLARSVGRWTISPDQVAVLAGPDDQAFALDLVYFCKAEMNGREVSDHELLEGLPAGGRDHYQTYWTTLLSDGFKLPAAGEFKNGQLKAWAEGVRKLVQQYGIVVPSAK